MLPQLAQGEANKIFVIPSEFSQALGGLAERLTSGNGPCVPAPAAAGRRRRAGSAASTALEEARAAAKAARARRPRPSRRHRRAPGCRHPPPSRLRLTPI
jgi:hypothetical protein